MTVLSIIYEKNFKVFKKNEDNDKTSKNNRITDILNRLGILSGEYDVDSSFESQIDYLQVKPKLYNLRTQSCDYLRNAIESLPPQIDKLKVLPKCEEMAAMKGCCFGEQTDTFTDWGEKHRILYSKMSQFPFALKEKCYRCKYYKGGIKPSFIL